MNKIVCFPRITDQCIKQWLYNPGGVWGEAVATKASCEFSEEKFPISLHFTTFPGNGVVPLFGDCFKVTIERATQEEMMEISKA